MELTRLLNKNFSDVKFQFVCHYLDDLVFYSEEFELLTEHMRKVFTRLKRAGLTVNPGKVKIASPSLSFLGHVITPHSVCINPERTSPISSVNLLNM